MLVKYLLVTSKYIATIPRLALGTKIHFSIIMKFLVVGLLLIGSTFKSIRAANEFVTCDFDLGSSVEPRLPVECQKVNDLTRQAMLNEAESFKAFDEKLKEYEHSFGMDTEDELFKDWEFRAELYEKAELHMCHNSTEILEEYLDCLVEKRQQMVVEIEKKMNNEI